MEAKARACSDISPLSPRAAPVIRFVFNNTSLAFCNGMSKLVDTTEKLDGAGLSWGRVRKSIPRGVIDTPPPPTLVEYCGHARGAAQRNIIIVRFSIF